MDFEKSNEQQLIDAYLDGQLNPGDEQRLSEWLSAGHEHVRQFVREAHLNRQLREAMVGRLCEAAGLATANELGCVPANSLLHRFHNSVAQIRELSCLHWAWTFVGAGTCLAIGIGLWVWCLGPNVGQAMLEQIPGAGLSIERDGRPISVAAGTRLKPGDVVRTASDVTAAIGFGPENTRMIIGSGTELELKSLSSGKRFALHLGKLEASVARQRPFRPMIITTSQAQARVLGTRFTLTASTNATRLDVAEGKVRFTRTRDLKQVRVAAGHYAAAAADYELAALPFTGSILREFWSGFSGKSLRAVGLDSRFPSRPERWDLAKAFELEPVQTNNLLVRFRGYLHPPVTGDYEFWIAGATDYQLFMSPSERQEDKQCIAQSLEASKAKVWDTPRLRGASPWAPPMPLVAGRRYYVEALLRIEHGEGHLSVAWKGPGRPRELLIGEFLSPAEPSR